jgi:type I restriction enzyme S subunit
MSLRPYQQYNHSGIDWLGSVPGHWRIGRIKTTTYLKGRIGWKGLTSDEYLEEGYAYLVTGTEFKSKFIEWANCHSIDQARYEDDPFIQLKNGDLLITKDGTIGKLALVTDLDRPACLNSGIFLIRPQADAYLNAYMYWVLSSQSFARFCDLSSFGSTIMHLYQNVFERFAFPLPPKGEQEAIVKFLDREIAKIDALVAEQQRLIELLKEKRQAVISHAVTNGLDPNAPMKDSGVEWLGEVPAHWLVSRLKRICSLLKDGTHLPPPRVDVGVPLLSVRNIESGRFGLRDDDSQISKDDYAELSRSFIPQPNDVLLAIVGATLGKAALIPEGLGPFHIQRSLAIFRTISSVSPKWLTYVFISSGFQKLLWEFAGYSAQPGIYLGTLSDFAIPRPPEEEQERIIAALDRETDVLTRLVEESETAVALLQERRSALISAAITGEIDVRGLVSVAEQAV